MLPLREYLLVVSTIVVAFAAIVLVNRPPPPEPTVGLQVAALAFSDAAELRPGSGRESDWVYVMDRDGDHVGSVVVSSPHTDGIRGYAGPTPLLIAIEPDETIRSVILLDNVETPSYLRMVLRSGFMGQWDGMHWRDAATMAPEADAVSGATITCVAVAETLRERLELISPDAEARPRAGPRLPRFEAVDALILVVLALGLTVAMLHGRLPRWVRWAQPALALAVMGVATATMLSLELLGGWARSWSVSGSAGLLAVVLVALLSPIVLRRNVYCQAICPFGALQELSFRLVPFRLRVGRGAHRVLRHARWGLLIAAAVILLVGWSLPLGYLEPFAAFRPRMAGVASLVIAGVGLLFSVALMRPWCTYGCPTGALLGALRRPRRRGSKGRSSSA